MEELDLKDLFSVFWNRKLYMILIVVIFVLLGAIYTIAFVKPQYKAVTTLVLVKDTTTSSGTTSQITQTDVTLNQKLVSTYSDLIKTKSVLKQVINNLNMEISEDSLKKNISVTLRKDTDIIDIAVVNQDPEIAAKIANETAQVFKEKVAGEIYKINNVYIADIAEVPSQPYNVNHTKDVIIFAFVGLIVAIGYALISNMLDNTIKTSEDVEKLTGLTVLASIPLNDFSDKGGKR